jgi:hypothetical protein
VTIKISDYLKKKVEDSIGELEVGSGLTQLPDEPVYLSLIRDHSNMLCIGDISKKGKKIYILQKK